MALRTLCPMLVEPRCSSRGCGDFGYKAKALLLAVSQPKLACGSLQEPNAHGHQRCRRPRAPVKTVKTVKSVNSIKV